MNNSLVESNPIQLQPSASNTTNDKAQDHSAASTAQLPHNKIANQTLDKFEQARLAFFSK